MKCSLIPACLSIGIDSEQHMGRHDYICGCSPRCFAWPSAGGDGSGFTQPNQGNLPDKGAGGASSYTPTDRMIQNLAPAGEQANFAGYTYDFAAMGGQA